MSSALLRRRSALQSPQLPSPSALQFASPTLSPANRTRLFSSPNAFPMTAEGSPSYSSRYMRRSSSRSSLSSTSFRAFLSATFAAILFLCLLLAPWVHHVHSAIKLQGLQRQLAELRSTTEEWQRRRTTAQLELDATRRRVKTTQSDNSMTLEQLQEGHMQLDTDEDTDSNDAATSNPFFLAAQDHEDALLERLDSLEDEIPRASSRALKRAELLFQTILVEVQLSHSTPLPNEQHLVLTLAPTTILPHTVETFIRNLDMYAGWTLHVSPQHHMVEVVQSVRPGLYVSTAVVGGSHSVNLHQIALTEHVVREDVPIHTYTVVYKGQGPSFGIVMDNRTTTTGEWNDAIVIGYVTQGQGILDYMYGRGAMMTATIERLVILPSQNNLKKAN